MISEMIEGDGEGSKSMHFEKINTCNILKAYSLISLRDRFQKFQNVNFFASICSFPPKNTFPQRNLAAIISL